MKAYYLFDMPENCWKCPFENETHGCMAGAHIDVHKDKRPDDCPLKPLPRFTDMVEENTALGIFDGSEPAWEAGASYGWGEYQRQLLNPKKEEAHE